MQHTKDSLNMHRCRKKAHHNPIRLCVLFFLTIVEMLLKGTPFYDFASTKTTRSFRAHGLAVGLDAGYGKIIETGVTDMIKRR